MTKFRFARFATSIAVAALCVAPRTAAAADDWQLTIAPYLWAVSLRGDLTLRGNERDVDASFGDIWDASDSLLSFNADVELHNGRFGLLFAPSYAQLGIDNLAEGTPLQTDFTFDMTFIDIAAEYRLVDWATGETTPGGNDTAVTFDVLAGTRYTMLDTELDFDAGPNRSQDKDWWDPIVGANSKIDLSSHWFMLFRGDVGGFNLSSDFASMAMASIGYRFGLFGHDAAVRAGYRAVYDDYDEGSGTNRFEWDMTVHGPTLGFMTVW